MYDTTNIHMYICIITYMYIHINICFFQRYTQVILGISGNESWLHHVQRAWKAWIKHTQMMHKRRVPVMSRLLFNTVRKKCPHQGTLTGLTSQKSSFLSYQLVIGWSGLRRQEASTQSGSKSQTLVVKSQAFIVQHLKLNDQANMKRTHFFGTPL